MLKVVLHALASSERSETPLVTVLVLLVWDDTPLNSASLIGHRNFTTLIRTPTGHMRFVPTHRQSQNTTATLLSAKWPLEMILVSNEAGREQYLDQARIHWILAPVIQNICHMTPAITRFFPRANISSQGALPQHGRQSTHPIPEP